MLVVDSFTDGIEQLVSVPWIVLSRKAIHSICRISRDIFRLVTIAISHLAVRSPTLTALGATQIQAEWDSDD